MIDWYFLVTWIVLSFEISMVFLVFLWSRTAISKWTHRLIALLSGQGEDGKELLSSLMDRIKVEVHSELTEALKGSKSEELVKLVRDAVVDSLKGSDIHAIVDGAFTSMTTKRAFKMPDGSFEEISPLELIEDRMMERMKAYFNGLKSGFERQGKDIEQLVQAGELQLSPTEMVLMNMVPKKQQWIIGVLQAISQRRH